MIKSKSISLIKTFSPEEFKCYGLFVRSPFFNRENVQIKFYDLLRKHYPGFDSADLDKEKIYGKLYPGREYNDGAMRNVISDALKLTEIFLSVKRFQADGFKGDLFLLEELKNRKLLNQFMSRMGKIEKEIENNTYRD